MTKNYIDNKEFLKSIVEYQRAVKKARKAKVDIPTMPNYLGECFYRIAEGFSSLPKYSGYRFREDMVSDAVLHCIKYINSFNPAKSNNPFGYFTKVVYHAFLQRIYYEKRYLYTKFKSIEKVEIFGIESQTDHHDEGESVQFSEGSREHMIDFMTSFEEYMIKKTQKVAK